MHPRADPRIGRRCHVLCETAGIKKSRMPRHIDNITRTFKIVKSEGGKGKVSIFQETADDG